MKGDLRNLFVVIVVVLLNPFFVLPQTAHASVFGEISRSVSSLFSPLFTHAENNSAAAVTALQNKVFKTPSDWLAALNAAAAQKIAATQKIVSIQSSTKLPTSTISAPSNPKLINENELVRALNLLEARLNKAIADNAGGTASRTVPPNYFTNPTATTNTVTTTTGGSSQWTTSGSDIYYDTGNIGIGTTNPSYGLDINGTLNIQNSLSNTFRMTHYDTHRYFEIRNVEGNSDFGAYTKTDLQFHLVNTYGDGYGQRYSFWMNGDEKMTIENQGNVGIGTPSPLYKLHVASPDNSTLMLQNTTGGIGAQSNINFLTYAEGYNAYPSAQIGAVDDGQYSNHIIFSTKDAGDPTNGLSERMRITSNGNVGIGTQLPGYALDVNGDVHANNFSSALDGYFASNVGIGTTQPIGKFQVKGSLFGLSIPRDYANTINGAPDFDDDSGSLWVNYRGYNNGTTRYRDFIVGDGKNGQIAFFDGSTGYVGIGTSSPYAKLSVAGTVVASNFVATSTSGSTFAGNVGIGSTNTTYPLDVRGTASTGIVYTNSGGHALMKVDAAAASQAGYYFYKGGTEKAQIAVQGNSSDLTFSMAGTPRMTILSGGNIGVGVTSPISLLSNSSTNITDFGGSRNVDALGLTWKAATAASKYVAGFENTTNSTGAGGVVIRTANTNSSTYLLQLVANGSETASFTGDGSAFKPGGGSFTATSDRRAKKDIQTLGLGLEAITALNPVTFKYNGQYATAPDNGKTYVGLIAQDVVGTPLEQYMISTDDQTGLYRLDPSALSFALVDAIKELDGKLTFASSTIQNELNKDDTSLWQDYVSLMTAPYHFVQARLVAVNGYFKHVFTQEVTTDKLCVGQTCVTEDQLKALLQNNGATAATQTATVTNSIQNTESISDTASTTESATISQIATSTDPIVPETPDATTIISTTISDEGTTTLATPAQIDPQTQPEATTTQANDSVDQTVQ